MIRPKKHDSQSSALTPEMKAEHEHLSRSAPTFGRVAPADYADRAEKYNSDCFDKGLALMMVVEVDEDGQRIDLASKYGR